MSTSYFFQVKFGVTDESFRLDGYRHPHVPRIRPHGRRHSGLERTDSVGAAPTGYCDWTEW